MIVIGASAGGVTALRTVAAGLHKELAAPVLIVLHIGAHPSLLPEVLSSAGLINAMHAEHDEPIRTGRIYIAPPDCHMTVENGRVRLSRGPKENWARPAIDPLFRSAAEHYGPGAIGVILTGNMNDGTLGLQEIKRRGGITVVQDPGDADFPEMPGNAAANVEVDYCLRAADIPGALNRLVADRHATTATADTLQGGPAMTADKELERPIALTCPDCGGALRRNEIGTMVEYRCHIQHVYTAEVLAAAHFDHMEKVLRAAERIVNERAEFCRQMAGRATASGAKHRWDTACLQADARAHELRDFVEQNWIRPENVDGPDPAIKTD